MSVSVSVICISVHVFKLHYSVILCQKSYGELVMSLFGEIINYIIAKRSHSDVSSISVSEKNASVPFSPCTGTDILKEVHRH